MKKHNETKSIKGSIHSKGRVLCKVIAFTMIFVMLFCISAYATSEEYTQNITVKILNGGTGTLNVRVYYDETTEDNGTKVYNKRMILDQSFIENVYIEGISVDGTQIISGGVYVGLIYNSANEMIGINEYAYSQLLIATEEEVTEVKYGLFTMEGESEEDITLQEAKEIAQRIYSKINTIRTNTDYSEYITLEEEPYSPPPVYEGFIGNARGLFDMIFESMQSIFNWLVSPNVIVFFGLGIILSLTTIGILIARRFFWGR